MNWHETEDVKEVFAALREGLRVEADRIVDRWDRIEMNRKTLVWSITGFSVTIIETRRYRIELPAIGMDTVITDKMEYSTDGKTWVHSCAVQTETIKEFADTFKREWHFRYTNQPETEFVVPEADLPKPQKAYEDVKPLMDLCENYFIRFPINGGEVSLSDAINHKTCLGYVFEVNGYDEVRAQPVMYGNGHDGNLSVKLSEHYWEKVICKAVRFKQGDN